MSATRHRGPDDLVVEHGVSLATAKRALVLLTEWGELEREGRGPLLVAARSEVDDNVVPADLDEVAPSVGMLFSVTVRRGQEAVAEFATVVDLASVDSLSRTLVDAVGRAGHERANAGDYEMDVRRVGDPTVLLTFVLPR